MLGSTAACMAGLVVVSVMMVRVTPVPMVWGMELHGLLRRSYQSSMLADVSLLNPCRPLIFVLFPRDGPWLDKGGKHPTVECRRLEATDEADNLFSMAMLGAVVATQCIPCGESCTAAVTDEREPAATGVFMGGDGGCSGRHRCVQLSFRPARGCTWSDIN